MANREDITLLVMKYCPDYRITFSPIHLSAYDPILLGIKAITYVRKKIMCFDSYLIGRVSPVFAKIIAIHEIGHALTNDEDHDKRWSSMTEDILRAEGLGRYAHPYYYRYSSYGLLWKLRANEEFKGVIQKNLKIFM